MGSPTKKSCRKCGLVDPRYLCKHTRSTTPIAPVAMKCHVCGRPATRAAPEPMCEDRWNGVTCALEPSRRQEQPALPDAVERAMLALEDAAKSVANGHIIGWGPARDALRAEIRAALAAPASGAVEGERGKMLDLLRRTRECPGFEDYSPSLWEEIGTLLAAERADRVVMGSPRDRRCRIITRAGRRCRNAATFIFWRPGACVCASHRYFGGVV